MNIAEWRQLLKQEARRQGMSFEDYLACRFPHSALLQRLADDVIRQMRKEAEPNSLLTSE